MELPELRKEVQRFLPPKEAGKLGLADKMVHPGWGIVDQIAEKLIWVEPMNHMRVFEFRDRLQPLLHRLYVLQLEHGVKIGWVSRERADELAAIHGKSVGGIWDIDLAQFFMTSLVEAISRSKTRIYSVEVAGDKNHYWIDQASLVIVYLELAIAVRESELPVRKIKKYPGIGMNLVELPDSVAILEQNAWTAIYAQSDFRIQQKKMFVEWKTDNDPDEIAKAGMLLSFWVVDRLETNAKFFPDIIEDRRADGSHEILFEPPFRGQLSPYDTNEVFGLPIPSSVKSYFRAATDIRSIGISAEGDGLFNSGGSMSLQSVLEKVASVPPVPGQLDFAALILSFRPEPMHGFHDEHRRIGDLFLFEMRLGAFVYERQREAVGLNYMDTKQWFITASPSRLLLIMGLEEAWVNEDGTPENATKLRFRKAVKYISYKPNFSELQKILDENRHRQVVLYDKLPGPPAPM